MGRQRCVSQWVPTRDGLSDKIDPNKTNKARQTDVTVIVWDNDAERPAGLTRLAPSRRSVRSLPIFSQLSVRLYALPNNLPSLSRCAITRVHHLIYAAKV